MIGVDLIRTERIAHMLSRHGEKALARFLCRDEIDLIKRPETAAGFWAAKEACAKALGCGIGAECAFHDILISKTAKGAPKLTLAPKVAEAFQIRSAALSITHDGDYAIAVVALESSNL